MTRTGSARTGRRVARPIAEPGLGLLVDPQPDEVTCGPACLHAVYRYYGDAITLSDVAGDLLMLDAGGTLDVFLANHALKRGYKVSLYTYNLSLFDPTWFALGPDAMRAKLCEQAKAKRHTKLRLATRGYDEFLERGGKLRLRDLEPRLLRRLLMRGAPVITGLSATYLYRTIRDHPETNVDDDILGEPQGHFVVLTGYARKPGEVLVADPYPNNPFARSGLYAVRIHRLINAILLGITTYDANLLVIEPRDRSRRRAARVQ